MIKHNIKSMSEFNDIIKDKGAIGITGYPGAGKTTLSNIDRFRGVSIIHTDDYLDLPHEDIPDEILNDIKGKSKFVIEGTQVVRLLKRGWQPDVLILVEGTTRTDCKGIKTMIDRYLDRYAVKVYVIRPRDVTKTAM